MAKYIVMRKDALHHGPGNDYTMIKSSHFPIEVDLFYANPDPEYVIRKAFEQRGWKDYHPVGKTYIVVRVDAMLEVEFKKKVDYDVVVKDVSHAKPANLVHSGRFDHDYSC